MVETVRQVALWSKQFAKWLYGTEHIAIQYSIDYDGIDIRKLSPGIGESFFFSFTWRLMTLTTAP